MQSRAGAAPSCAQGIACKLRKAGEGEPAAIEEHGQLSLSVRDSEAFVDALLDPKPVNDRLRGTVRCYRERTGV
ncbi:DUF1778 domain-containing protein [Methylosinus sp. Sm6]|uniref:type II toxin -antitoxin system TacA 1-like antitoxin n=1 Tax=Methylosinus sp. Sm6 TaxID=2866948 RepID=UPI00351CCE90